MAIDIEARFDRLDRFVEENRIITHRWVGIDERGRELACLLGALAPEVGAATKAEACPAEIIPEWWARLTPALADGISPRISEEIYPRWAQVTRRASGELDAAGWAKAETACRAVAIAERLRHVPDTVGGCVVWRRSNKVVLYEAVAAAAAAYAASVRVSKLAGVRWFANSRTNACVAAQSEAWDRMAHAMLSAIGRVCDEHAAR